MFVSHQSNNKKSSNLGLSGEPGRGLSKGTIEYCQLSVKKPMKKVYAYSWFKSEVLHPLPWSLISWCPDLKDNYQFNCLFSYIFKENINPLPLLLHVFWASFGPPGLDFNLFYCSCFIEGQQRFFCVIRFLRSHKNWASYIEPQRFSFWALKTWSIFFKF